VIGVQLSLRRLPVLAAGVLLGLTTVVAVGGPAQAHRATVSGVATCDRTTGEWEIVWTIHNDMRNKEARVLATESSVKAEITEIVTGAVVPRDLPSSNDGKLVGKQRIPGDVREATLNVKLDWPGFREPRNGYTGPAKFVEVDCERNQAPPNVAADGNCDNVSVTVENPEGNKPAGATLTYGTQSKKVTVEPDSSEKVTFPRSTSKTVTVVVEGFKEPFEVAVPAKPASCSGGGGGLPVTGASVGGWVAASGLLLAAGAALFLVARRRRIRFTA
jgi:LPXTG-motif cell wall-anchored protein